MLQSPPSPAAATPNTPVHLGQWLAKEWGNFEQHLANPPFWAYVRVSYRPLPWSFLDGVSFYMESVYDYMPKQPYRATIIKVIVNEDGRLETESYKIERNEQFYTAAFDSAKLRELVEQAHPRSAPGRCTKLSDRCNAVFEWSDAERMYRCRTRPGKQCIVRRNGMRSYLDAQMTLASDRYTALDVGRDPETDELLWGAVAGAFDFGVLRSWSHEVPSGPSAAP